MKNLLLLSIVLMMASCGPGNRYAIEVSSEGGPGNRIVHNNWDVSSDTLNLAGGKCQFTGTVDTFPKLVSIGFTPPSYLSTRMVLEPGKIKVDYTKETGFRLGGTKNNTRLQELFDEMKPSQDEAAKVWKAWNKAYAKTPRNKEECEAVWILHEEANQRNLDKTRELIKANPNFAGLVITLPIARNEPVEKLKEYVDEFREFENSRWYKMLLKEYEIAEKTISGKPVPGFTFPDTTGKMVSLSDFKGKWVLLDFWYVDCPWCRKLTPHMIDIYKDWKQSKNFEIISISVDKPKDYQRWKDAIVEDKSPWTQVLDSTKTYPNEYGITGYPTLILIDPNGNGVKRIIGYQEKGGLRRLLGEYIK
jgi:peroxiredoxin